MKEHTFGYGFEGISAVEHFKKRQSVSCVLVMKRRIQMREVNKCPCCGEKTLPDVGEFDICSVCKWEDDPLQRDNPDDNMGANTLSLNQYKAAWVRSNATHQPRNKSEAVA
jgi:hypothetical protein